MKILILLLYYERPEMVKNALISIKNLEYDNWHLAFIDDGSTKPGRPVVENILRDFLDKISFYNTNHSIDDKNRQGGSMVGGTMNLAIDESDASMALMLCDDDALLPTYLSNLNSWAEKHPDEHYCYSHVILYDPWKETPHLGLNSKYLERQVGHKLFKFDRKKNWFNKAQRVMPEAKLDASQLAWRTYCNKKAKFPLKRTCHLDSAFYKELGRHYGHVGFSGFFGQYKGIHDDTLSLREESTRNNKKRNLIYTVKDIEQM